MLKNIIIVTALIIISGFYFYGCQTESIISTAKDDEKLYGITKGSFRHKWWNYYERGVSFSDGQLWKEAEADFREALSVADTDERRARTYGMHFTDYFPHRELGIALFHQKRYSDAIKELETSLSTEKSARAEFYLDKTRKTRIEEEHLDGNPPDIFIEYPTDKTLSNAFSIAINGIVKDDTFVKTVRINGKPIRIDISAPQISFNVETPILQGKNQIVVESADLTGKTSKSELTVLCDRAGPILNIDSLIPTTHNDEYTLKGYAYDDSGIKSIRINGQDILSHAFSEVELNHSFVLSSEQEKVIVVAEDLAGNQTQAELLLPHEHAWYSDDLSGVLLAALESDKSTAPFPQPSQKIINQLGNYHALIIGINDYNEWTKLKTAVNDATAIRDVLISRYSFPEKNVRLITDKEATLENINKEMLRISTGLKENDNLLIFFAGHGIFDKEMNDGYWIPIDGKLSKHWTWISHSSLTNQISSEYVKGKNIVIIADACYSGNLLRGIQTIVGTNYEMKLLEKAVKRSRQIISSGGLEPVTDEGKDNHSLFTYYLLKALEENKDDIADLEGLVLTQVWKPVSEKSRQTPTIGRMKTAMDDEGRFVLALKSGRFGRPAEQLGISATKATPTHKEIPVSPRTQAPVSKPLIHLKGKAEKQTDYYTYQSRLCIEGNVSGKDEAELQYITINNQNIIRKPGKNLYFNHLVELKEGNNKFIIRATDKFGNSAEKELNVTLKIQEINKNSSRMSVTIQPFEISGKQNFNFKDIIGMHLSNIGRFDMKEWKQWAADPPKDIKIQTVKGLSDFLLAGSVAVKEKGSLQITVRVIEVQSSHILTYEDIYTENTDSEAINDACQSLAVKLCDAFPIEEGSVAAIKGDDVIVNLGERNGLKKGMHLLFFQKGLPVMDEKTKEVLIEPEILEIASARIHKLSEKASYTELFDKKKLVKIKPGMQVITK